MTPLLVVLPALLLLLVACEEKVLNPVQVDSSSQDLPGGGGDGDGSGGGDDGIGGGGDGAGGGDDGAGGGDDGSGGTDDGTGGGDDGSGGDDGTGGGDDGSGGDDGTGDDDLPDFDIDGLTLRGDPGFSYAALEPEERLWYDRVVESMERSAAGIEEYASGRNLYRLGRTVGNYNASLLMALRATGDLRFLDRVAEITELYRATLADEWLDGTTDGYMNWIYLEEPDGVHYGKDTIALEEALMHGNVALVAYAFHVNRDLDPSYAEKVDFWVDYLENQFLAKWTERAGDPIEAWESGNGFYKRLLHPRSNQLRLAYYLWKITGNPFYLDRADEIADQLLAHVEINPDHPDAYRWKHQVSGGDLGWQKITYAQTFIRMVTEMHLEEFRDYADSMEMTRYAATFAEVVYGKYGPPYDTMALRVDGSESESTEVYSLSGLARWDGSGVVGDVAEIHYASGTYGVFNAGYMLMAVSRR